MEIKYRNTAISFEVNNAGEGCRLERGGTVTEMKALAVNKNTFRINRNGRWTNVYVAADENRYYIWVEGRQFVLDKLMVEEKSFGEQDTATGDTQKVFAPMPGSIVKVMVEAGQKISEGEPLIIVEAMKMETTLYSSIDGTVTGINAVKGEQVNTDKVLITVEKEINVS